MRFAFATLLLPAAILRTAQGAGFFSCENFPSYLPIACQDPEPEREVLCVEDFDELKESVSLASTDLAGEPTLIELCSGTIDYTEDLVIDGKNINVVCLGPGPCVLDGGNNHVIFKSEALSMLTVTSIEILRGGTSGPDEFAAVFLGGGGTSRFDSVNFVNNIRKGAVYVCACDEDTDVEIEQCNFENNAGGSAVEVFSYGTGMHSPMVEIDQNTFKNNIGGGIEYDGVIHQAFIMVTNNSFEDNSGGLLAGAAFDNIATTIIGAIDCTLGNMFVNGENAPIYLCDDYDV